LIAEAKGMIIVDQPFSSIPPHPDLRSEITISGPRLPTASVALKIIATEAQKPEDGTHRIRESGMSVQVPTMLYVDVPTLPEFKALATVRADACVSIYLSSSPLMQDTTASRAQLKALGKTAIDQLDGIDKRRRASIEDHLAELAEDHEFWKFQAHSLVCW
jgi:hypothetical protein